MFPRAGKWATGTYIVLFSLLFIAYVGGGFPALILPFIMYDLRFEREKPKHKP